MTKEKNKARVVYVLTGVTPEGDHVILGVFSSKRAASLEISSRLKAEPDLLSGDDFYVDEFEVCK